MKKKDMEAFRTLLLELRRRLASSVSHMQNEALGGDGANRQELSDIPFEHLADRGSDTFACDLMLSMIQDNEAEIIDIDRALKRIEEGTYGRCESCAKAISEHRLKALPFARLCIGCKQVEEKKAGAR